MGKQIKNIVDPNHIETLEIINNELKHIIDKKEKQRTELNNQIESIFNEHWNLRDIKCKSASCVWIDGEKVKEKLIELFEEFLKKTE